jgi:hypothetical protein
MCSDFGKHPSLFIRSGVGIWGHSVLWFSNLFLPDLTRVKSGRACLPFGRRVAAPAQAGAA